jgi:hypothetical protein
LILFLPRGIAGPLEVRGRTATAAAARGTVAAPAARPPQA